MGELRLTSNGHHWRTCGICKVLEDGHDHNPDQVRELFRKARDYATKRGIPIDLKVDYAQAYINTCNRPSVEPQIPDHVRYYCASLGKLKIVSNDPLEKSGDAKGAGQIPKKTIPQLKPKPHFRSPIQARG